MITDVHLAHACQDVDMLGGNLPVDDSGITIRITETVDGPIVAFRGSVTPKDWARDFLALPIEDEVHPQLGMCHAGFLGGAESVAGEVSAALGGTLAHVTGHSLGGALALGVGAILLLEGKPPKSIVTFGAPRFGGGTFVNLLLGMPIRQYRRGNDPVPLVPFDVPPLIRFFHAREPLIQLGVAQRDAFACHHLPGYIEDLVTWLAAK